MTNKSAYETTRLLVTEATQAAIVQLRSLAYAPKFADRLRNEALLWNRHDDESFHFGAYAGSKLVSTIRLTFVEKPEMFETIMQLSSSDSFASLPCWVLSRAATAPEHRGQSVNMKLRCEAYRFILARERRVGRSAITEDSKALLPKYVFGTALKDSRRISFLQSIGYEFLPGQQNWDGYISALADEVLAFRLAIEKLESALLMIDPRR
jgi:hypothetical protein